MTDEQLDILSDALESQRLARLAANKVKVVTPSMLVPRPLMGRSTSQDSGDRKQSLNRTAWHVACAATA
jgi:hypothetical protein